MRDRVIRDEIQDFGWYFWNYDFFTVFPLFSTPRNTEICSFWSFALLIATQNTSQIPHFNQFFLAYRRRVAIDVLRFFRCLGIE